MGRRPALPVPQALHGMGYDIADDLYCIISLVGITYKFPYQLMNDLKRRYKNFATLEEWYNALSKEDRRRVVRDNLPPAPADDYFFPDVEH